MRTLKGKFICVIFAAMILLFLVSAKGFAATTVGIQPAISNQSLGSFFDVFVDIEDVIDLFAFQFDISFDPAVLHAVSTAEGSFLPTGGDTFFIPGIIDNTTGSISFTADSLLGPDPGVTGNGHLAVLSFEASGLGTSPISLSNWILLDSTLSDISFTSKNGSVNVPEPTTMLLLGLGLIGLIGVRRRMSK